MKTTNSPQPGKRPRKKRATAAQLRSWAAIRRTARAWAHLTEEQRLVWRSRGTQERSRSHGGKRRRLSGQKYFMKVNTPRAFRDLTLLELPPGDTKPLPTLHAQLTITSQGLSFLLKLRVTGAGHRPIEVFASPPHSPGREFCHDFRYLCPLPPGKSGLRDITAAYLKKFHKPPPGSRVFIQLRQFVDGQREPSVQTHALVPGYWQGMVGADLEA